MSKLTPLFFFIAIIVVFGLIVFGVQQNAGKQTNNLDALPTIATQTNSNQSNQQQAPATQDTTMTTPAMKLDDIKNASITATIKTSKGNIVMELYPDVAPNTVAIFVEKAKSGFYNNLTFHRVEDWVIQGGDPSGNGTGGGNEIVEFNQKPFVVGSLGQASRGDGKVQNDSQFFITKKDSSYLNGQYTNYGMVTQGMDVVNSIAIGDKILGITIDEK